jgi:hypothetical protein
MDDTGPNKADVLSMSLRGHLSLVNAGQYIALGCPIFRPSTCAGAWRHAWIDNYRKPPMQIGLPHPAMAANFLSGPCLAVCPVILTNGRSYYTLLRSKAGCFCGLPVGD